MRALTLATTAFALLAGAASAQTLPAPEPSPVPLTLEQALALADRQSPELGAVRARQEAEEARAQAAGHASWPRLSVLADVSRTDNPARVFAEKMNRGEFTAQDFEVARLNDPSALNHLTSVLGLEVPLDVSGRVRAAARAQQAQAGSAGAEASEARQQVRLRVVDAYHEAALARAAAEVTSRARAAARAREADVEAQVSEGAALQADLLRVRARRRERDADLAQQEQQYRVATAALGRALGAAAGERYEAVETAAAPAPLAEPIPAWTQRAQATRGTLAASQTRLQAAQWAAEAESRWIVPDLALYGQLQDDRGSFHTSGGQSGTVGAVVRWSAFDPTRSHRVAAARAGERAAEQLARAATDQVRLDVESAWWQASSARERWAAAAGGAEEGREALRIVRERRQEGMATLTDELETEAASLAAELQELQAATDAARADAALRRAAGEL